MRYKLKRTYSWSSNMAYVVGLIASDGCLLNDLRHIDFTSKDRQLVELYRKLIRPEAKIGIKLSGIGRPYFRVQLGDVALYDFLTTAGLTPRKSHTIKSVAVPDVWFADFLRGLFDGDGSISGYMDKRWRNSYMFYTTYVSASQVFLEWLQQAIQRLVPEIRGGTVNKSGPSICQLSYAKHDSRQLFRFMYKHEQVPCLQRKYKRYLEIFALDPYAE
jgi:hypothetical protein